MGFRRHPALRPREIGILLAIAMGALAVIGALLAADVRISAQVSGGGDFYSLWAGSRAYLLQQSSPYSVEVAGLAQSLAYGRNAAAGENPFLLTIPLFLFPLFFPFGFASAPAIARGVWLCLSQAALVGSISVSLSLVEWKPPRLLALLIGCLGVFGFYTVSAFLAGTPTVMLTLLYTGTLWALRNERDELAGALMVLSLFMWEVGGVFLVLIALRVFHQRRWGVLAGLAMTLALLLGVSFLLDSRWILPFLTSVVGQMRSVYGASTASVLTELSPRYGALIARSTTVLVLIVVIYEWWSGRDGDFKRFVWLACLALAITPLLGLRSEVNNLVVLGPSIVVICAASVRRGRFGALLGLIILITAFLVPWLLVSGWLVIDAQTRYGYLFLFYPLLGVAGLYWTRWWFLRPRRTWLDEVRAGGHGVSGHTP